jgi:hypothetical protein
MNDMEFLAAFESAAIAPGQFDHRAHIRAAYLYLSRHAFLEGCAAMRDSLKRFAASIGKSDLYNETITIAFMSVVQERMNDSPGLSCDQMIAANPDLVDRGLLHRYYRPETLNSAVAKKQFVLGDIGR